MSATYATASAIAAKAAAAPTSRRPGLLVRLFAGMIAARQRKALEEIKRHSLLLPRELELAGLKVDERSEDTLPFVR